MLPIFISAKKNPLQAFLDRRLEEIFKEQYQTEIPFNTIDKNLIVPIIDDFHSYLGKTRKEKILDGLKQYEYAILTVDKIFSINFKEISLVSEYTVVEILEFKDIKRNELIEKWLDLDKSIKSDNQRLERIDRATEVVNTTLGRAFINGIMPSYPFFILSVLGAYYTGQALQDITSQGYCYQFVILMNLGNQGVKGNLIDTYLNFLTHLSHFFFTENKKVLNEEDFTRFLNLYTSKYNLPEKIVPMKNVLDAANILRRNAAGEYYFKFRYLYYYFVARFFAEPENFIKNKILIDNMVNSLHKDEYAYVIIFLTHHIKNDALLEEIEINSLCLFDKFQPATLKKDDVAFLEDKVEEIALKLPALGHSPEDERVTHLKAIEESSPSPETEDAENALALELRRAIKTVEVIGQVIKNRAGSLDKTKIESLFEFGMNVCLRILSSYFEIIKDEKNETDIIQLIASKLKETQEKKDTDNTEIAKKIFRQLNFLFTFTIVHLIVSYLGSDQLEANTTTVTDRIGTPAAMLVKHGILMKYKQGLNLDEIASFIQRGNWPLIAKQIMFVLVSHHYATHHVMEKRGQIEAIFGVKDNRLLVGRIKEQEKKVRI